MTLTPEEFEHINRPIETAQPLPPRAFVDNAFYEHERKQVFQNGWYAVGFTAQLPDAGDARPVDVCQIPLFVVRGEDGTIRAFHNLCPYDNAAVVNEPIQGATILRAMYHGWEYDFEGRFQRAPLWGNKGRDVMRGDPEVANWQVDLQEVAVGIWGGVIFVNPSNDSQPFDDYIAPLAELRGAIDFDRLDAGRSEDGETIHINEFDGGGNWKTVFENYIVNILHESFVHEIYKVSDEVPRLDENGNKTYEEICDRGLYGLVFRAEDAEDTYPVLDMPPILEKDGAKVRKWGFLSLYPNLHFAVFEEFVRVIIMYPLDAEHTRMDGISLFEAAAARAPELVDNRQIAIDLFNGGGEEDSDVVKSVQARRRSPAASAGFYSPFWDKLHYTFSRQVAADIVKS